VIGAKKHGTTAFLIFFSGLTPAARRVENRLVPGYHRTKTTK